MSLGEKLRKIRESKKMTIREISRRTNLSSSLVSKIELGRATPSLSTLKRLTEELGVPMFYLFIEDEAGGLIVRKDSRVRLVVTGGIEESLVSPDLRHKIEVVWTDATPGASTGKEFMEHGSEECTLVIRGSIRLYVGNDVYLLKDGDSVYIEPRTPHRWENAGSQPAELVSSYSLGPL